LSGSEQNPDLTGKSVRDVIGRARADVPAPVKAFMDNGADFVVEKDLDALVRGMNAITGDGLIDAAELRREITARDREIANPFTKDLQVTAIHGARAYLGD
ncbi:FAD-binding dehydrogenase, partial [Streptomyces sp. SID7982]|nr:FAD-binding dehydrogenase [Streptomyces sp. SID7982]